MRTPDVLMGNVFAKKDTAETAMYVKVFIKFVFWSLNIAKRIKLRELIPSYGIFNIVNIT